MPVKVTSKQVGSLTDLERRLSLPVREVGEALANRIATRMQQGQGPRGKTRAYKRETFSPFARDSGRHGWGDTRHWVPPNSPHPGREGREVKHGPFRGWAIYPSWEDWNSRLDRGPNREYRETGELWDRKFTVKQLSPRLTRLYFLGRHGASGIRASVLAARVSADEPGGLLTPSQAELQMVQQMSEGAIAGQLAGALGAQEAAFQARRQLASLQRRTAKTLGISTQLVQALTLR